MAGPTTPEQRRFMLQEGKAYDILVRYHGASPMAMLSGATNMAAHTTIDDKAIASALYKGMQYMGYMPGFSPPTSG